MKKLNEDILTDNTIDWESASYWCIFNDKDFTDIINVVAKHELDEAEDTLWDKLNKAVDRYNKTSRLHIPTTGGPNADFNGPIAQDVTGNAANTTQLTLQKIIEWIESAITFCKEKLPIIIPVTIVAAVIYSIYKTRKLWLPKVKLLIRKITQGNKIAKCIFTSNEHNYLLSFDLKKKRWVLDYYGFKSSIINSQHKPTAEEFDRLVHSDGAQKFISRCSELADKYLSDKKTLACIAGLAIDKKLDKTSREICEELAKNSKAISNNIKSFKIAY